jgi:hypothetical protein
MTPPPDKTLEELAKELVLRLNNNLMLIAGGYDMARDPSEIVLSTLQSATADLRAEVERGNGYIEALLSKLMHLAFIIEHPMSVPGQFGTNETFRALVEITEELAGKYPFALELVNHFREKCIQHSDTETNVFDEAASLRTQLATERERNKVLLEWLHYSGQHRLTCASALLTGPCDCGLEKLLTTPPSATECQWKHDENGDSYSTSCGHDIAFPDCLENPPVGRDWLRFCSGCGKPITTPPERPSDE